MRGAYLGPAGTFSEEALSAAAPELEAVPVATLRDVVLAVQRGTVERAIVPFENALEGGVDPVLDALALEAPDVALIAEHVQPVVHNLVGPDGLALDEVETVLSHPQALAQCARWLSERLPHAVTVPMASTADAVREVAGDAPHRAAGDGAGTTSAGGPVRAIAGRPGRAAIGPRLAAERYGARVLAQGIEDEPGNATRFALLAPAADAPAFPPEDIPAKTALVYWGAGSGSPGWLVDCLTGFASRGVNLVRIESRPLRQGMGRYMFFLDLEGSLASPAVAEAVEELRTHAEVVRVLGSFPAATS
jgi:prephenate dehydratase